MHHALVNIVHQLFMSERLRNPAGLPVDPARFWLLYFQVGFAGRDHADNRVRIIVRQAAQLNIAPFRYDGSLLRGRRRTLHALGV